MDYADAVATFWAPRPAGTPLPEVVRTGGLARRLRDSAEPLAMHAVWNRHTNERLAALGLDFIGGYVGGRAASLGEPSPPVVAAAFAWFEPNVLASWYEAARAAAPRDQLVATRDSATAASLAEILAGDDPAGTADLLADAAQGADGTGRPLFSGLRGRGRPRDPYQRLWWACADVRRGRPSGHGIEPGSGGDQRRRAVRRGDRPARGRGPRRRQRPGHRPPGAPRARPGPPSARRRPGGGLAPGHPHGRQHPRRYRNRRPDQQAQAQLTSTAARDVLIFVSGNRHGLFTFARSGVFTLALTYANLA